MSVIKIRIDQNGNAEVKPQGFTGDACIAALKPLEDLLGAPERRERTAEAYSMPLAPQTEVQQ